MDPFLPGKKKFNEDVYKSKCTNWTGPGMPKNLLLNLNCFALKLMASNASIQLHNELKYLASKQVRQSLSFPLIHFIFHSHMHTLSLSLTQKLKSLTAPHCIEGNLKLWYLIALTPPINGNRMRELFSYCQFHFIESKRLFFSKLNEAPSAADATTGPGW